MVCIHSLVFYSSVFLPTHSSKFYGLSLFYSRVLRGHFLCLWCLAVLNDLEGIALLLGPTIPADRVSFANVRMLRFDCMT